MERAGFCSAAKASSYAAKRSQLRSLYARAVFVLPAETHGIFGSQLAFRDPPGVSSIWAAGTSARGGVGVVVNCAFLQKFHER